MGVAAGQAVWLADGYIISRLQNAAVNPNPKAEVVSELGNEHTVGTVRDQPDLTFDIESLDSSVSFEAQILGLNSVGALSSGAQIDFNKAQPLAVLSSFRSSKTNYSVAGGAVVPHLGLQKVQYRFGVKQNATQSYSFLGDQLFYIPGGSPMEDKFTSDGVTSSWTLSHPAILYANPTTGTNQYVLNVTVQAPDGSFYRLQNGANWDYTDSSTTFALNAGVAVPVTGSTIRVHYGTTFATTIAQSVNDADGITVKPAALRSRNINVYIGTSAATPVFSEWRGIQSVDAMWSVNLEATEQMGSALVVSQDYVTASVNGTVVVRSDSVAAMLTNLSTALNVPTGQVIGALSSTSVPIEIHLNHPETGARLKSIYVPDARFDIPDLTSRVGQKIDINFKFNSDTGQLYVYNGARPGGVATP
jgi:hypothetical protein